MPPATWPKSPVRTTPGCVATTRLAAAGRKLTVQFAREQQVRQLGVFVGLAAVVAASPPVGVVEVQFGATVEASLV